MAIFGMESSCIGAPGDLHHCGTVCLDYAKGRMRSPLGMHHIHNEDVIFIKTFVPQTGLDIKAVGIVQSSFPFVAGQSSCISVKWVWTGDKHIGDPDDRWPLRGDAMYEEYNLTIQRAVLDMLPPDIALPLP